MRKVNGVITEATEQELMDMWLMSNWNKTATFDSFKRLMVEEGCKIIQDMEVTKCLSSQTVSSAQTAQSEISELPTSAIVNPSKKEEQAVLDIVPTVPVQDCVKNVPNEMPVKTKNVTESTNETVTSITEKSQDTPSMQQNGTQVKTSKPVIIVRPKTGGK